MRNLVLIALMGVAVMATSVAGADGRPYYQIGTTCYAWVHQGDDLEEQALATLRKAPFNPYGCMRGILIFGSRIGPAGALPLETIRKHQTTE